MQQTHSTLQSLMPEYKKNDTLRFLYLNIYSLLIVLAGIIILIIPLYLITKWTLIIQAIVAIKLFIVSGRLFSTWDSKKREINILRKRNEIEFRPNTFEIFMQAPCGKLIVRQVLRDLNRQGDYKSLLKLQKPLLLKLKNNCTPTKTIIHINEDAV